MVASPGEPYVAHALQVCAGLDFHSFAEISLDANPGLDELAAAGVREAHLVIEPLLRRAAELGHSEAQFCLGALHAGGVFVDYDDLEALKWYRKAADQGHAEAAYQIIKYLRLDQPDHRMTHAPTLDEDAYASLLATAAAGDRLDVAYLYGDLLYEQRNWVGESLFEERPGYLLIERAAVLAYRPAMERLASIHVREGFARLGAQWYRGAAQVAFLEEAVEEACVLAERSGSLDGSILDDEETVLASVLRIPVEMVDWHVLIEQRGGKDLAFRMASRVAEEADWEGGAESWLRIGAELGHGPAAFQLAGILGNYWIYQNDLDAGLEAARRFAEAVEHDIPGALEAARRVALGLADHFVDEPEAEVQDQAHHWFEQAAALECREGRYHLRCRLLEPGGRYDPTRAYRLLSASAEAGFPAAAWETAECLRKGVGIDCDFVRALHWYRVAADQGFSEAQLQIGRALRDGAGVDRDLDQAFAWFAEAAEGDDPVAQHELGEMLLEGWGTPASRDDALACFRKAADQGYAPSRAKVDELERPAPVQGERFVVIDFETTGLSPRNGDRVIEVGAVEIVDGRIGRRFQSLANPGFPVSARITGITGITNAMLAGAPPLAVVMRQVAEFIQGATLVAHNASFDQRFLQAEMERLSLKADHEMLCTMRLGKRAYPGLGSYKLAAVASHSGVSIPETLHRALADASVTAALFLAMREREAAPPTEPEYEAGCERVSELAVELPTLTPEPPSRYASGWRRWLPAFG